MMTRHDPPPLGGRRIGLDDFEDESAINEAQRIASRADSDDYSRADLEWALRWLSWELDRKGSLEED